MSIRYCMRLSTIWGFNLKSHISHEDKPIGNITHEINSNTAVVRLYSSFQNTQT